MPKGDLPEFLYELRVSDPETGALALTSGVRLARDGGLQPAEP